MKSAIYYLLLGTALSAFVMGEGEIKREEGLKPPGAIESLSPTSPALQLKELLEQGKIEEFYKEARSELTQMREGFEKKPLSQEDLKNQVWFYYYVARAPVFEVDYADNAPLAIKDGRLDLEVKRDTARFILSPYNEGFSAVTPEARQTLAGVRSTYSAAILRQLREKYDSGLRKRINDLYSEKQKKAKSSEESARQFDLIFEKRKIGFSRNELTKSYTDFLDVLFVEMLVRYYPNQAEEVKKFIKQAGYSEEEIPDLFDRSIGKNSRTEFLYKGRPAKTPLLVAVKLRNDVRAPDYPEALRNPGNFCELLKQLLNQGKREEFYNEAQYILISLSKDTTPLISRNPLTEVAFKDWMYLFYFVSAAPLFEKDFSPDTRWGYRDDVDVDSKVIATHFVHSAYFKKSVWLRPAEEQEVKDLKASYFASIMRQLREYHDPDLEKKFKEIDQQLRSGRGEIDKIRNLNNKYAFVTRRNGSAPRYAELSESRFVSMLIDYYPGKATDVKKYIKLAGFTEEEIEPLINRTLGRDGKTEFLYKSRQETPQDRKAEREFRRQNR